MSSLSSYLSSSHPVTLFVLGWLSIYFIVTFTIFVGRKLYFSSWKNKEKQSIESMLLGSKRPKSNSILSKCSSGIISSSKLNVCKNIAESNATLGLSWLSVIASTSPFIGLFGTVVSILETFNKLGQSSSASLNVIAPAISEALIATAGGIFVAIPAYTFYIILKKDAFSILSLVQRQIELILSYDFEQNKQKNDV